MIEFAKSVVGSRALTARVPRIAPGGTARDRRGTAKIARLRAAGTGWAAGKIVRRERGINLADLIDTRATENPAIPAGLLMRAADDADGAYKADVRSKNSGGGVIAVRELS
ncbi:hypothetical protein BKD09_17775 [Bradyrhizobium japonicum]|uniref:Uncharacterized protein n=1 Tax=Bradyrhizobium japonicum TaxID=375 RepID=A0A1L3FA58_BRAJP|nr:hypothetical protein BKD09_17775 [Bradyrhizobium japonicum]